MINYYLLTKPGIILGNLVTVTAGFLLATNGSFDFKSFFATLIGLTFIIASACVFNNYIDCQIDKKMKRTKNRPLVTGLISGRHAIAFAIILGILGNIVLFSWTNLLAVLAADVGFFIYVVLYSFWKYHTIYGTAIGSLAGAVPPVVGYLAASGRFDAGAFILFAMLLLWQMPHFFSIAIYHLEDYTLAGIPVLPVIKGIPRTKVHMALYIIGFIAASLMLTFLNYTGYIYLIVTTVIGFVWLGLGLKGFLCANNTLWGRDMFRVSLLMISAICLAIFFDAS